MQTPFDASSGSIGVIFCKSLNLYEFYVKWFKLYHKFWNLKRKNHFDKLYFVDAQIHRYGYVLSQYIFLRQNEDLSS
jgi:hypothetical protein